MLTILLLLPGLSAVLAWLLLVVSNSSRSPWRSPSWLPSRSQRICGHILTRCSCSCFSSLLYDGHPVGGCKGDDHIIITLTAANRVDRSRLLRNDVIYFNMIVNILSFHPKIVKTQSVNSGNILEYTISNHIVLICLLMLVNIHDDRYWEEKAAK